MAEEEKTQAEAQAEAEQEAAEAAVAATGPTEEAVEALGKVPDPGGHMGTVDTSGTSDALVSDQMEHITPAQMANSGHVDELQEVADRAESEAEAGGQSVEGQSAEEQAAETEEAEADEDRPAGNASQDDWHAYRLANGYTEEELEGKGRDELRDLEDR